MSALSSEAIEAAAAPLAIRFSCILREWLTPYEMERVRAANAIETNDWICHSHDFCDANMAMLEAWKLVYGDDPDYSDLDLEIWNIAWGMAQNTGFRLQLQ